MNFVFTGTFKVDGDHIVRDLLIDTLTDKGHTVQSKVDWATSYLVRAPDGVGTVKDKKAMALGTSVITPDEFWSMLTKPGIGGPF
jgi:NAD-dependent DNA ligase